MLQRFIRFYGILQTASSKEKLEYGQNIGSRQVGPTGTVPQWTHPYTFITRKCEVM